MKKAEVENSGLRFETKNMPSDEAPPVAIERPSWQEIKVPPIIQKALSTHRHDLPELMEAHAYEWAAYHGGVRLEIGRSAAELYHKYLDRGLSRDELVVLGIGPEPPDEIDAGELLDL
jgi:hypothetical protein